MPIGCREVHRGSHEFALVGSELEQEMAEFRAADGTRTFPTACRLFWGSKLGACIRAVMRPGEIGLDHRGDPRAVAQPWLSLPTRGNR